MDQRKQEILTEIISKYNYRYASNYLESLSTIKAYGSCKYNKCYFCIFSQHEELESFCNDMATSELNTKANNRIVVSEIVEELSKIIPINEEEECDKQQREAETTTEEHGRSGKDNDGEHQDHS